MEWDLNEPESLTQARLMTAAPEFVFQQLKFYGENLVSRYSGKRDLENLLLKRGDRLIDLALAQFGKEKSVVSGLYKRASETPKGPDDECYKVGLRVACLSNRNIWHLNLKSLSEDFDLNALMAKGSAPETWALLTNPSMPEGLFESLYTKVDCFAQADEKNWLQMVGASSRNERLNTCNDGPDMPDIGSLRIHRTIFQFLEKTPVSTQSAHTAIALLSALDPAHTHDPEAIDHVLQRWSDVEFKDYKGEDQQGHFTHLTLKEEMRCLIAALFCRKSYTVKDGPRYFGSADAEDIAMRCAFYAGASEDLSADQIEAGFKRDQDVFTFAVLKNRYVLLDEKKRALIERHVSGRWLWREYQRRCEQLRKQYPGRFRENTQTPEDKVPLLQGDLNGLKELGCFFLSLAFVAGVVLAFQNWGWLGGICAVVVMSACSRPLLDKLYPERVTSRQERKAARRARWHAFKARHRVVAFVANQPVVVLPATILVIVLGPLACFAAVFAFQRLMH
jgi:hypothetical protein